MFLRESGSLSYLAPVSCVAFPKRGKHDASWYVICCACKLNAEQAQHCEKKRIVSSSIQFRQRSALSFVSPSLPLMVSLPLTKHAR